MTQPRMAEAKASASADEFGETHVLPQLDGDWTAKPPRRQDEFKPGIQAKTKSKNFCHR
jgi:hypothetical protein